MTALSLAEAKQHLGLSSNEVDSTLLAVLKAAEAAIAVRCGDLEPVQRTEVVRAVNGTLILRGPLVSVDSVTLNDVAQTVPTLTATETAAGIVCGSWSGDYVVTYTAGRSTLPEDLKMGVKELVAHLWATTQRSSSDRRGRETPEDGSAYLFPRRVEQWIAPYVIPGIA